MPTEPNFSLHEEDAGGRSGAAATRESLLDAAEELFSRQGMAGSSLRAITRRAGANLASVHYHFGSKEGLIRAVFSRRLGPLNEERLRLLSASEAAAGSEAPSLEAILHAFTAPVLSMVDDSAPDGRSAHKVARLIVQVLIDPDGPNRLIVLDEFREVRERFCRALARALPHLPPDDLYWRFHFMVGAMAHTAATGYLATEACRGEAGAPEMETTLDRLIRFLAAGMRSPLRTPPSERLPEGGD